MKNEGARTTELLHYCLAGAGVAGAIVFGTVYDNPGLVEGRETVRSLAIMGLGVALATAAGWLMSPRLGRTMPIVVYLVFCTEAWLTLRIGRAWMNMYWSGFAGMACLTGIVLGTDQLLERTQGVTAARMVAAVGMAMGLGTGLVVARDLGWAGAHQEVGIGPDDGWVREAMAAATPERLPDIEHARSPHDPDLREGYLRGRISE